MLKKGTRAAVAWVSPLLSRVVRRAPSPLVRVLMYHRVREVRREPFSVAPGAFAEQMEWLARQRLAIGPDAVAAWLAGGPAPRDGSVLVTFDDGYRDFHSNALPVLRRHHIPAVLFVSVGEVAERRAPEAADDSHVTWPELREIADSGVAVGSHGWDHVSLARIPIAEVRRQVTRARETLRSRLGEAAGLDFAYPYGTGGDFGAATREALAAAGHRCGYTAVHGAVGEGEDRLALPRDKVEGGEGLGMFRRIVAGGLDAWSVVDRGLWRWQAERRVGTAEGGGK